MKQCGPPLLVINWRVKINWHATASEAVQRLSLEALKDEVVRRANAGVRKLGVRASISNYLEESKDLGHRDPNDSLGRDAAWEFWLSDKVDRSAISQKLRKLSDKLVMQTNARTEGWVDRSEEELVEPEVDKEPTGDSGEESSSDDASRPPSEHGVTNMRCTETLFLTVSKNLGASRMVPYAKSRS